MADIIITEFMDDAAVAKLAGEFDVIYDKDLVNQPEKLAELAKDCKALIVRNRTQVKGSLLAGKNLKVIGRLGVGLDNIDVDAAKKAGITVIPATGANNLSVAEYVITGLLMLLRSSYGHTAEMAAGLWPREKMIGRELAGKTLGLIGFGAIARNTAQLASALGMNVIAYDPYTEDFQGAKKVSLNELLENADAVSLHVPLTEQTKGLLDVSKIVKMKKGAVLINAARGGIVDEKALAEALENGHLGGAIVDVFEKEPMTADNPLAKAPNCILTPHIAGVTKESNVRVSALIGEKVAEALYKEA